MARNETREEAPSYGLVGICRQSNGGGGAALYGSDLRHPTTICLKIMQASHRRDLGRDWHYGEEDLISILLSPAQFTEMITTPNMGFGVPCTIEYTKEAGHIKHAPEESRQVKHQKELRQAATEVSKKLERLEAMIEGLTNIPKKTQAELRHEVQQTRQQIESNLPYAVQTFAEHMEKVTVAAKADVEAFVLHKLTSAGLQALGLDYRGPEIEAGPVPALADGTEETK